MNYSDNYSVLPLLALRGIVAFPDVLLSFDVERESSIDALGKAVKSDRLIFLAAQKDVTAEIPETEEIYRVGTVCRIRQQIRQPFGTVCRVMVEGLYCAYAEEYFTDSGCLYAKISRYEAKPDRTSSSKKEALFRNCVDLYQQYAHLNPDSVSEQILSVLANPKPDYVVNYIAGNIHIHFSEKQKILEERAITKKLSLLCRILTDEIAVLTLEKELNDRTQEQLSKNQREYFLREEMKLIQEELGEDFSVDDISEYRSRINSLQASDDIKKRLNKELSKLAKQPFGSSEGALLRSYIDVCLEVPWSNCTTDTIDIAKARKILDEDHFGIEKVKSRIIEFLSVKALTPKLKCGCICLVGPPGVGKTSIAFSVARALNRKVSRISLGGVHDEAEIRGHRKTYIGAMPGRIINGIVQSGVSNPLMILDEIDKLGSDYRGDPSSALLEVLDPEQNSKFRDNFLEIPFDLSDVFFITTANSTDTIPRPLLDRMEVIEMEGYTDEEKLQIAKRHLLPKQRKKHGISGNQMRVYDDALRTVIDSYTRESGVRVLERELAKICRVAAVKLASGECKTVSIKKSNINDYLGTAKYRRSLPDIIPSIGIVHGLAYTVTGGEVLDIEVSVVKGTGKIDVTGNLGDIMKESVRVAVAYIRSKADELHIDSGFYQNSDIHIHFPEGAVPKDGPSAGAAICTALVSALTGRFVKPGYAMTGEISIRGRLIAIGGLKEKTMAALRMGYNNVLIPADNVPDLDEIDPYVRQKLNIISVSDMNEVIPILLEEKRMSESEFFNCKSDTAADNVTVRQ